MKTDKEKILEMMQSLDEMKQRMDPILKNIERLCDNIERLTKVPAFKDGDAASRKVIEYKWMPKFDETYWTVEFSREDCVASYKYDTEDFDGIIFGNGMVFQTRDEAIECAKKMLDAIK